MNEQAIYSAGAPTTPRPLDLDTLVLSNGYHATPEEGMCLLEAVAYVAGEPFSDHPACVSPVLAAFLRNWNDALPDADRTRLLAPLIPRLIGTVRSAATERRRSYLTLDWSVRVSTPTWLRDAGLADHATVLAELPELTSAAAARQAQPLLDAARDAAGDAARDAAGDAARAALDPTVDTLQRSALALVDRMIQAPAPGRRLEGMQA